MIAGGARRLIAVSALAFGTAAVSPEAASAHALVGKGDLPLPIWMFAWGASLVLIISFALLAVVWQRPRLQDDEWRPLPARLSAILVGAPTRVVAGIVGVGLLCLTVYAGLQGTEDAARNFSVTFVFVTFWLGLVVVSAIFGDVFSAFNPWRSVAVVFSKGFSAIAGQTVRAPLKLPDRAGRWPAAVGLLVFGWLELVWGVGATQGMTPRDTAIAAIAYSVYTWIGMGLYGIESWCARGEVFSSYFGMFSSISSLEVRKGALGRRRFLSGLPAWRVLPGSLAIVLIAIGITTFDGAQEGALAGLLESTGEGIQSIGLGARDAFRVAGTLWLLVAVGVVSGLYWAGIRGMHTIKGSAPVPELARSFAHTLVPIALAYLVAHYFSFFVFQEQAQFTYLLSDPLGNGADLFGTASAGIDYGLIGVTAVWWVQVISLLAGHVCGLVLAHDRAISIYSDPKLAYRSQYWMLAVMVAFTCLGLYLLSQANA